MTGRAILLLLLTAVVMPALGRTEEAGCVKKTNHHLRTDLDGVDMFGAAFAELFLHDSVSYSEISEALGKPAWTGEAGGVTRAKWVHGSEEVTEEISCHGESRKIYSTDYYVMDAAFRRGVMTQCFVYEDGYIALEPTAWKEGAHPLLRKKFDCKDYLSKLK